MRFGVSKYGAPCSTCRMRILRQTLQMDVTEGDHDLQRQRDQRQQRSVPSMEPNPTHPQPALNPMVLLRCNILQEGTHPLMEGGSSEEEIGKCAQFLGRNVFAQQVGPQTNYPHIIQHVTFLMIDAI
jgi:hypothetical protein